MALTDKQVADAFRTWKARHYPHSLPQHLESYVQQYLNANSWYASFEELEQVKLKNRVITILRREGGLHGAVTRKKNGHRKVAAARVAELALAQIPLDFERDNDT